MNYLTLIYKFFATALVIVTLATFITWLVILPEGAGMLDAMHYLNHHPKTFILFVGCGLLGILDKK